MIRRTTSSARRMGLRITESQVSAALGFVLLFFFVDGFLRGATPGALPVLVAVGAFIVVGLVRIADPSAVRRIQWQSVVFTIVGTMAVGTAVRWLGLSSIFSAACMGIVAGAVPLLNRRVSPASTMPLYLGGLAGMTSPVVLLGPEWLFLAGTVTGLLWSVARDAWIGIGGKMGTVAFAGVGLTTLLAYLLHGSDGMASIVPYAPLQGLAVMAVAVLAAATTHWLAYDRGLGPMLGSAAPVAVVVLVTLGVNQAVTFPNDALIAAWFGGAFVGMTAPERFRRWWARPLMGIVFGTLLITFQAHLSGLGGDLGATAAAAVIAVIGFQSLFRGPALPAVDDLDDDGDALDLATR